MKKKIVFIITKSEVGGAQTWVHEMYKLLNDEYDIYLIISDKGWLTSKFPEDKVKVIPEIKKMFSIKASIKISNYLKKIGANVTISNSANAGLHSRIANLFYKNRCIYVSHGWSCIYNGGRFKFIFCYIERLLSYLTDSILCVSQKDFDNAKNIIGIPSKKLKVIKNGTSPKPIKSNINLTKKFLFVGRLAYPKRPNLFIEASRKFPQHNFYLVGDGPLSKNYSNITQKNLFFLGEIKNFISFNDYDVFVLSSDSEGLPMSAIEAGSAGVPLLLSNVGGCSELIHNNGIIFENNIDSLLNAIQKILNNYHYYYQNSSSYKSIFHINTSKQHYMNLIDGVNE
ncbi:glycosyltransferase [Proteus mirabilis]|uniref:glycosyltransferase n=1 Tax=Proteus mirabilis TaxID=584 RepID=UPI0033147788